MTDGSRFDLSAAKKALLDALLAEADVDNVTPAAIPRRSDGGPALLSFAQERLWFLDQLGEGAAYHLTPAFRLRGSLNEAALRDALARLVQRHAALRTVFIFDDGQPRQLAQASASDWLLTADLSTVAEAKRDDTVRQRLLQAAQTPIDLATGPVFRALLLKLGPDDHVLQLLMHHICADEWAVGVLLRELALLYDGLCAGQVPTLPDVPLTMADYATWQRAQMTADAVSAARAYWLGQLAALPEQIALPTDGARAAGVTTLGGQVSMGISAETTHALTTLSRRQRVTLFTTLLSAFAALLMRLGAGSDIPIGTPIAQRERPELANIVGYLLNTLVLRCQPEPPHSFIDLVQRTHATVLDAFEHQAFPFEQVVEALQPVRDLGLNPLFQVMFVIQHDAGVPQLAGLTAERVALARPVSQFDLTLFAIVRDDGLRLTLAYRDDLFAADSAEKLLQRMAQLLDAVAEDANRPIHTLPVLLPDERAQLDRQYQATAAPYPDAASLYDLVATHVRHSPNAIALQSGNTSLTYRQLADRVQRLARVLCDHGVGADVPVGVMMQRSMAQIVAVLAIHAAGGAVVPLDPAYPPARIAQYVADCQPALIVVHATTAARALAFDCPVVTIDALPADTPDVALPPVNPNALAYILYTSGSTGTPKGVALAHRPLVNLMAWQRQQSAPQARTLQLTSLNFDVAFQEIYATLGDGGTLVLVDEETRRDPAALLAHLADAAIERLFLPIVALQQLAEAADRPHAPRAGSLREVITAGEQPKITPAIGRFFTRLPGCTLTNQYGPTESHVVTAHTLSGSPAAWPLLPPMGRPIANAVIHLLDAQMQPVPPGVVGRVFIGGVALARGYWRQAALSAERFVTLPLGPDGAAVRVYDSGDLARSAPDGTLHFLGRADAQIKVRGYRVEPEEVAYHLAAHPAVATCAVTADASAEGTHRLLAYVVPTRDAGIDSAELRHHLQARLPSFMIPAAFVTLDALPLTPTGKIDRRRLPRPDRTDVATGDYAPPADGLESQLTRIWEAVLGVQPVGRDDNFFDLGGHSLLAIKLFAEIEARLGVRAPLALVFSAPTVRQLADRLRATGGFSADWSILIPIQPQGTQRPFFCVHGVGGGVVGYGPLARYMGTDQPFFGLQAVGQDGVGDPDLSVEAMAERYLPALRAVQPTGPYRLGGYCFGGLVAYEMACRLVAQGEEVSHVAILEGYAPVAPGGHMVWRRPRHVLNFVRNLPYWLEDYVAQGRAQMWSTVRRKSLLMGRRVLDRLGYATALNIDEVMGDHIAEMPSHVRHMLDVQIQAQIRYRPKPYPGAITLYRIRRLSLLRAGDPLMGWGALAQGGVVTRIIAGGHRNVLEEPHVQTLAQQLRDDLHTTNAETAEAQPPTGIPRYFG